MVHLAQIKELKSMLEQRILILEKRGSTKPALEDF
jgi:hypothetical protein